jgi:hypothetical protein
MPSHLRLWSTRLCRPDLYDLVDYPLIMRLRQFPVDNFRCFETGDAPSLKIPGILRLELAGKRLSSHGFLSGQDPWRDGQLGAPGGFVP